MATVVTVREQALIPASVERVWEVVSATNRYAEWADAVLEVTEHHGTATVGKTYSERNVTLGPLTTRSIWTVQEIVPQRLRVDTGTGFEPMRDMMNVFEFRPLTDVDGNLLTEMTYQVSYRPGLGAVGRLIDRIQKPGLRSGMRRSMRNLSDLLIAESAPGE
ncbi:SRPBCC family protein [Nocardia takedensis]|uniref:SRPBCC family protein n=1 Tax=Nocardia takedensis TaxID=259390 RepID=UPI00059249CB|nr:SRPBCC family protein [Nocardia takedensis]